MTKNKKRKRKKKTNKTKIVIRIQTGGRRTGKKTLYNWKFLPQYEEKIGATSFFFFHLPVKLGEFNNITQLTHTRARAGTCAAVRRTAVYILSNATCDNSPTGYRVYTDRIFARPLLVKIVLVVCRPRRQTAIMCICVYLLYSEPALHHVVHGEFINLRYPSLRRRPAPRARRVLLAAVFQRGAAGQKINIFPSIDAPHNEKTSSLGTPSAGFSLQRSQRPTR